MAGNDQVGAGWGKAYDGAIGDHIRQVCQLADCVRSDRVSCVPRRAQSPERGVRRRRQAGASSRSSCAAPAIGAANPYAAPPSVVGEKGPGLNSDIPGLVAAVGVSVPHADPTRLTVAGGWRSTRYRF